MPIEAGSQVYHLKVDTTGRIVLPSEAHARNHIVEGDTVVVIEGAQGLHVKTGEQIKAEVQAYFADLAPARCTALGGNTARSPCRARA
jgi:bifunctional DNA-binding transcriptional regulator/antitoxin component of YhaV-PrlF toxin-antitoxin module